MRNSFNGTPEWEITETRPSKNLRSDGRRNSSGRPRSEMAQAILDGKIVRYKGASFGSYSNTIRRNMPDGKFFHQIADGEYVVGWIDDNPGISRGGISISLVARVSKDMFEDVKESAAKRRMTISDYMRKALSDALEYEE